MKVDNNMAFQFRISSLDDSVELMPENLPAHILAEYLKELSSLIAGRKNQDKLVLSAVTKGSANVQLGVAPHIDPAIFFENAKLDNEETYRDLLVTLEKYNHKAELKSADGLINIELNPESLLDEIIVTQEESYSGQVIKIGGNDATIHLNLKNEDGIVYKLTIRDIELAREIGQKCFLGDKIICYGEGEIRRNKKGQWLPVSNKFLISKYKIVEKIETKELLEELKSLPTPFGYADDPIEEWKNYRMDGL